MPTTPAHATPLRGVPGSAAQSGTSPPARAVGPTALPRYRAERPAAASRPARTHQHCLPAARKKGSRWHKTRHSVAETRSGARYMRDEVVVSPEPGRTSNHERPRRTNLVLGPNTARPHVQPRASVEERHGAARRAKGKASGSKPDNTSSSTSAAPGLAAAAMARPAAALISTTSSSRPGGGRPAASATAAESKR